MQIHTTGRLQRLDQQRVVFREEHFDRKAFFRLADALQELELGTVDYRALQRNSWTGWLTILARSETDSPNGSDAVVFLGPTSHFESKVPAEVSAGLEKSAIRFFYFEYYPWFTRGGEFPDSIDSLTRNLRGTVFKIRSVGELGQAIHKMVEQVDSEPPDGKTKASSGEAHPQ